MAIRITYNSVNIDLTIGDSGFVRPLKQEIGQQRAASGKVQTVGLYNFAESFSFDAHFQEAVYRQLIPWMAWAEQGKSFAFNTDSDNAGNTTLDAGAAAAQKVIPLTATTAFAATDVCLIRSADRTKYEIVVIASVSAGVSVTATDNLVYTYTAADTFKHWEYWPTVKIPIGWVFNPTKTGSWYQQTFEFFEAV